MTSDPEPLIDGAMVAAEANCRRCGYNLRGLPSDGLCPECAHPVEASLKQSLENRTAWRRELRNGCEHARNAQTAWLVAGAACVVSVALPPFAFISLIALLSALLIELVSFFVLILKPSCLDTNPVEFLAYRGRFAACTGGGYVLGLAAIVGAAVDGIDFAAPAASAAWVLSWIGFAYRLQMLGAFLDTTPNQRAAQWCRTLARVTVGLSIAWALALASILMSSVLPNLFAALGPSTEKALLAVGVLLTAPTFTVWVAAMTCHSAVLLETRTETRAS